MKIRALVPRVAQAFVAIPDRPTVIQDSLTDQQITEPIRPCQLCETERTTSAGGEVSTDINAPAVPLPAAPRSRR
jgi:hypothetical protein